MIVMKTSTNSFTFAVAAGLAAACISFAGFAQDTQQSNDSTAQTPYENKVDIQYQNQDDRIPVSPTDLPPALAKTLKQSQYRGWEEAGIFRTSDGKVYELQMGNDNKKKVYRFDANGKAVKE